MKSQLLTTVTTVVTAVTISITVPIAENYTKHKNYTPDESAINFYDAQFNDSLSRSDRPSCSVVNNEEKQNYLYVNPELLKLITSKEECNGSRKSFVDHYLYLCFIKKKTFN